MTIFSFFNQKGGVGKTTCAVNCAGALASRGARVLLVDLDSQCSATLMMGKRPDNVSVFSALMGGTPLPVFATDKTGVYICPGQMQSDEGKIRAFCAHNPFALRDALAALSERDFLISNAGGKFDFIIVDLPNHRSPSVEMGLHAADVAVLVVKCEPLSLPGLAEAQQTVDDARAAGSPNLQIRVLLNDHRKRPTSDEVADKVRADFPGTTFEAVVPNNPSLSDALLYAGTCAGMIVEYGRRNNPARRAFESLALEVEDQFAPMVTL